MSDALAIFDMVERFLSEQFDRESVRSVERGAWPGELWDACEALGLPMLMVAENAGGIGIGWAEAHPLFEALGRHAVALPLGETIVAAALLSEAGIDVPSGPLTFAWQPASTDGHILVSHARWGGNVVLAQRGQTRLCRAPPNAVEAADSIAREPRDRIALDTLECVAEGQGRTDALAAGAFLRSSQIAGALAALRDLSIEYANLRVQFGKPIGKFQAVQQALAQLAGEAAAASVGASMAARALDRGAGLFHIAVAKIRAGEAAGMGATIAHQTHGAIGFTDDHRLHDLTRRLWTWRDDFGGERFWADRLGALALEAGPDVWAFITAATEGKHG
jgi:acyl-CoA dehydrogenase